MGKGREGLVGKGREMRVGAERERHGGEGEKTNMLSAVAVPSRAVKRMRADGICIVIVCCWLVCA